MGSHLDVARCEYAYAASWYALRRYAVELHAVACCPVNKLLERVHGSLRSTVGAPY